MEPFRRSGSPSNGPSRGFRPYRGNRKPQKAQGAQGSQPQKPNQPRTPSLRVGAAGGPPQPARQFNAPYKRFEQRPTGFGNKAPGFQPARNAGARADLRPGLPVQRQKSQQGKTEQVKSLIEKAIAKNGKKEPTIKEGLRREEGFKPKKGRGRGRPGAPTAAPRMGTYKHKPYLKTGTDADKLTVSPKQRLKIVVLGGNEEVGRNMTLMEYGDDIILIDMGLQFPDEDMPGVDYIIPNTSYLKGKEKNIRGVLITHAHLDHIGAIPHLSSMLGNPPIFGTDLSCALIKKRQEDHRDKPPLNLHVVKKDDILQLGVFKIEFFGVAHSIPTAMGLIVNTPCGLVVHTGDFKLDPTPGAQSLQETAKIMELGQRNVLALMIDSTNASHTGRQLHEYEIQHNIDEIIANSMGRVIIGTFSSMIARIQQIILACERQGRKVAVEGFSMKSNLLISQELGYIKVQKGTLIDTKDIHKYPRNKVAIVCTGAQGEERAVLMRIANREHPIIEIEPGDTVVFSSSVIPGNERSVQRVTDTLYREGANVVHYKMMDVHAGGHAKQDDLLEAHRMIRPKYLIPIEGHYSFLVEHAKAAVRGGFNQNNIFIADNGQVIEFDRHGVGQLTNKKIPTEYVFVDGLGVGDTNHVVLRDRQELAGDGVVVVLAVVSDRTGKLMQLPELISRGFIYMKDQGDLMNQARKKVAEILHDNDPRSGANAVYLKEKVRNDLGEFLFRKTERRPMILPVIVEV